MLTDAQIKYAQQHEADLVSDVTGMTLARLYHTERGVYVLVHDVVTDELIESYYVTYKILACANLREWKVNRTTRTRTTIVDGGDLFHIRRKEDPIHNRTGEHEARTTARFTREDPGFDWADLVFDAVRDKDGYPLLKTEWITGETVIQIVGRDGTGILCMNCKTSKKYILELEYFNEYHTPYRV